MTAQQSSTNKFMQFFPVIQWVWAGVFFIMVGFGTIIFTMKMEGVQMRSDVDRLKADIQAQEARTAEQVKVLNSIYTEQVKLTEALKNINENLVSSIKNTNDKIESTNKRIDDITTKGRN